MSEERREEQDRESANELPVRLCPQCAARLESRQCKLVCPRCGFFMSCSEFE